MDIHDAVKAHEDELMRLPNVTGVAVGLKGEQQVIKVYVQRKVRASELRPEEVVPGELDGYQTDVEELGVIQAEEDDTASISATEEAPSDEQRKTRKSSRTER